MNHKFLCLIAMILTISIAMMSCKKKKQDDPVTPTTETKYSVYYEVGNQFLTDSTTVTFSPIFAADITYFNENGDSVVLENVALPWSKTITVSAPFTAKIHGKYVLNVAPEAIPTPVIWGKDVHLNWKITTSEGWAGFLSKTSLITNSGGFFEYYESHPSSFQFNIEQYIE